MPLRNPSKLVTVLLLLSQLLFAVCAPGLAFCQESDGALSVEWTAAGCCTVSSPAPGQGAGPRLVEQDDCAGCQDSLLGFPQRVETPDADYLLPPQVADYDLANALPPALPRIDPTARCRAGPTPPHLKTTVLRH